MVILDVCENILCGCRPCHSQAFLATVAFIPGSRRLNSLISRGAKVRHPSHSNMENVRGVDCGETG